MQDSFSLKNSPLGVYLTQTRPALAVELGSLRISECRVILNKETGLNLPANTERNKGMHAYLAAFEKMDGKVHYPIGCECKYTFPIKPNKHQHISMCVNCGKTR